MNIKSIIIALMFLFVTEERVVWADEDSKIITLNGKDFRIPAHVLATSFSPFGLSAPLSFRIDAETLQIPTENIKDKTFEEKKRYVQVQVFDLEDQVPAKNKQAAWQEMLKTKKPRDCKEYVFENKKYSLCYYDPEGVDKQSTRIFFDKDSKKVLSVVHCSDTLKYIPRNPMCSARSIVFNDIEIYHTYITRYVDKTVEIAHTIHRMIESFHNAANVKEGNTDALHAQPE